VSRTGLAVFDKTLHETNLWLKKLMELLGTHDRAVAYGVLKATLHALRDRIGPENATHLAAQLPILLRGVYYEGWHLAGTPTRERHTEGFLDHVRRELAMDSEADTELATRAVFEVMWEELDQGEVAKLIRMLPTELRELWTGVDA